MFAAEVQSIVDLVGSRSVAGALERVLVIAISTNSYYYILIAINTNSYYYILIAISTNSYYHISIAISTNSYH